MLIDKSNTILLIIDVQEKLFKKIINKKKLEKNSGVLIKTFKLLNLPIFITEQYPEGLGKTIKTLSDLFTNEVRFEKSSFSCAHDAQFKKVLKKQKRKQILLLGIETHVCVLQSAFDLQYEGYIPYVITDAVGSRNMEDHESALTRLITNNINILTTEMVVFELLKNFKHPKFREISKLIK